MFRKNDPFTAWEAGSKGGRSRSIAKQQAARRNAKAPRSGRPPTRTLAEKLLNRAVTSDQCTRFNEACREHMHFGHFHAVAQFFRIPSGGDSFSALCTMEWHKPRGKVPADVRRAIALLKVVARYCH